MLIPINTIEKIRILLENLLENQSFCFCVVTFPSPEYWLSQRQWFPMRRV